MKFLLKWIEKRFQKSKKQDIPIKDERIKSSRVQKLKRSSKSLIFLTNDPERINFKNQDIILELKANC